MNSKQTKYNLYNLILCWIASQQLVWDIVTCVFRSVPSIQYIAIAFQVMALCLFCVGSLMLSDRALLEEEWSRHPARNKAIEWVLDRLVLLVIRAFAALFILLFVITKDQQGAASVKEAQQENSRQYQQFPRYKKYAAYFSFFVVVLVFCGFWMQAKHPAYTDLYLKGITFFGSCGSLWSILKALQKQQG